ncbi:MAG TPA: tetratricopeptide repeat protein [Candidatus Obscuribacterales bacterium]
MRPTLSVALVAVVAPVVLALVPAIPVAAGDSTAAGGRAGHWRRAAQDAPSVEACKKRAEKEPNSAEAHNDLGWALRQHGDLEGAERSLREAIRLDARMPQAHCNLSVVLLDKNDAQGAVQEASEAAAIDPEQPIYRVVLGNALAASGDLKGAIEQYRAAISRRPDYENAHYNLGRVLYESGDHTQAKFSLAEALRLDPNDDRALSLLDKITGAPASASPSERKSPRK